MEIFSEASKKVLFKSLIQSMNFCLIIAVVLLPAPLTELIFFFFAKVGLVLGEISK